MADIMTQTQATSMIWNQTYTVTKVVIVTMSTSADEGSGVEIGLGVLSHDGGEKVLAELCESVDEEES